MAEPITLTSADGVSLEGELAVPDGTRAGVVLCHPHPEHGGSMRSVVTGALFEGLPGAGIACLRFNFRGVGESEGSYTAGDRERDDAVAALARLHDELGGAGPLLLVGWSFGGDVALSVADDRHAGWMAVAPPLRFVSPAEAAGADPRPKLVVLAEHDQFRAPAEVEAEVAAWPETRVEMVGGADHFFIGRTDRLVAHAVEFATSLEP